MQLDTITRFADDPGAEVVEAASEPTMAAELQRTERRLRAAQATHLGYPYNLAARRPR